MNLFLLMIAGFPLSGQPGVMFSDRPVAPVQEPRDKYGRVIAPAYNGYTPPGKSSMECWQETHTCYGSDGSMVPMQNNTVPQQKPINKKIKRDQESQI